MYSFLISFFNDLDKFSKIKAQKEEKTNQCGTASELYSDFLETFFQILNKESWEINMTLLTL